MSDTTTRPDDEQPTDEQPTEDTKVDEQPVEDTKVDEQPTDEQPTEDTKIDEQPTDEQPTEDTKIDEQPTDDEPVVETVEVEATSEEPLPDVPEGELPEGVDPSGDPLDDPRTEGDPADMFDQPEPAEVPTHDGSDRPEAHDFTATDGPPDLVDPYDSVDMTNPWDSSDDDPDPGWGQDSLTDIGVAHKEVGDWNVYTDNRNGNTFTDHGNGTFEASVGDQILTGDAAAAAFTDFTNTRLVDPAKLERLQENAYNNAPATSAAGGSPGGSSATPPGGDVGGGDVGGSDAEEEQMGPPSSLANDGGKSDEIVDRDGDGEIGLADTLAHYAGRLLDGPAQQEAHRLDKEMGGDGRNTSTRGEQKKGAEDELDRQEEENKPEKEKAEKEETDEKTDEETTDGGATKVDHPGWGDGNRGGVSVFDELGNMPGHRDPRDPGNVDPVDDGYGDGAGDASSTTSDDLTQPAGPDAEPSGSGTVQPRPDPIDYGPDHVDPIGSGPYDDDPLDIGDGTVSLDHDEPDLHDAPVEMADDGLPEFEALDLDLIE